MPAAAVPPMPSPNPGQTKLQQHAPKGLPAARRSSSMPVPCEVVHARAATATPPHACPPRGLPCAAAMP
eukprot:2748047-Alexandrium_andersonii.AAC.1